MLLGETNQPSRSRIPNRSASPSVAKPASAFFSITSFFSGARWSSDGSGPLPSNSTSRDLGIAVPAECPVEPSRTATMQRVANEAAFRFLDYVETNQLLELRKIRLARINP